MLFIHQANVINCQTIKVFYLYIFLIFLPLDCLSALSVIDDIGKQVKIEQSVQRIISLAPHTTELLFSAGAGDKIVGAVKYSDYPEAAKQITRIGDTHSLDMERIISLEPDLIVAWHSGNGPSITERLKNMHYPVYISEPDSLRTIAKTINDLGVLAGTELFAKQNSNRYLETLQKLTNDFSGRPVVKVFYQFWHQPIFTINGEHVINEVIQLCGGRNIFSDLPTLSPQINQEAVLKADPEVIIASGADETRPLWLDNWQAWPMLSAVKNNNLYSLPPDLILRHTPRILEGAIRICEFLDKARQ